MSTPQSGPSRTGYWVGGVIAVLGVAAGVALLAANFTGVARDLDRFERLPVPGGKVLSLPVGKHVVYIESGPGEPPPTTVEVRVQEEATGTALPLEPYATSFTYTTGDRHGRAAQTFVVERAGRYRVAASGPAGAGLSVTVGPPLGGTLVNRIAGAFGGFGLLFGGPIVGGIIILVTAVRRNRARRPPSDPAAGQAGQAQPGWYPDPSGQARQRWWDGQRWTDHTA